MIQKRAGQQVPARFSLLSLHFYSRDCRRGIQQATFPRYSWIGRTPNSCAFMADDAVRRGPGTGSGGEVGDVVHEGGAPQRERIGHGLGALGGIDDELDFAVLHGVHHVGPPFQYLVDSADRYPFSDKKAAVPPVARIPNPALYNFSADVDNMFLVGIPNADEGVAGKRQFDPGPSWALAKASAKVSPIPMTSPVDFISGPRMVSTPGNLTKGKTDSFTEICCRHDLFRDPQFPERLARHDPCRDFGQRPAGGLGDEGDGPRGPRVHLKDEDHVLLHRELDVHEPPDASSRAMILVWRRISSTIPA